MNGRTPPVRQSRAVGPGRLAPGKDEKQPGDAAGRANVLLPDQGVRRGRELGGRALLPHRDEERRPSVSVAGAHVQYHPPPPPPHS